MQSILFQELRRFCRTLILFLDIFELRAMIKILANMSALKEIYWLPFSENYLSMERLFCDQITAFVSLRKYFSDNCKYIFQYLHNP